MDETIQQAEVQNPLATEKVSKLIRQFALPAIAANLVGAIYNIVDQIFIGQSVGTIGNSATNIAYPLVLLMTAFAVMFGAGGASHFSLRMGESNHNEAKRAIGNSLALMAGAGVLIMIVTLIFLKPIMYLFGARGELMDYSMEYSRIIAIGIPFYILSTGGSQLIRADGNPNGAMLCTLLGAVLNCILDPIFIFGFDMGMTGAALATIIGQIVSACVTVFYFFRFKSFKIDRCCFKMSLHTVKWIFLIGLPAGLTQFAHVVVQTVTNNTIGYYGELSVYGRTDALAAAGVVGKIAIFVNTIASGIGQSCQPIIGFNYGAKKYKRVKDTVLTAAKYALCISCIAYLLFLLFPNQLIGIFGSGSEMYFDFAKKYLQIYYMMTPVLGFQIIGASFFPSIGKPVKGIVTSLSRQVIFLMPLMLILPMIFGINGIFAAGPIADFAAVMLAVLLIGAELKKMNKENK